MNIVGLDLGKRNSQLCIGTPEGKILQQIRVPTTREGLEKALGSGEKVSVLLESSTSAEWVARCLEALGHEVIIGDPRFGPMYAQADKAIKTDKRDAAALFHARRLGAFKTANRRDDENRQLRHQLLVRTTLVRMRAKIVVQIRALLEAEGIRVKSCATEDFSARLEETAVAEELGMILLPLMSVLSELSSSIDSLDNELDTRAAVDPVAKKLDDVVGVGTITALAFMAAIGSPKRFSSAREVASYMGLVPREYSSGEKQQRGTITKSGDTLTRSYLVQAAWRVMRSKSESAAPLRDWANRVSERRGKKRAAVALARRLSRIMFAIWRDDKAFDSTRLVC